MLKLFAVLLLALPLAIAPAHGQTIASCAVDNDDELFVRLKAVTNEAIARVHDDFDYLEAVRSAWKDVDMKGLLETEAETAGEALRQEWGFFWTYLTGYGAYAQRAAEEIADRVFASEAFGQKVQAISEIAILQLSERFAADSKRLSEPLQFCITEYLEANYAPIIQGAARSSFVVSAQVDGASVDIGTGRAVTSFAAVMVGIVLIVTRRITRRIASRVAGGVARRVTAKVASRFIPIVGWLLLAYEVLFQTAGAVPAIVEGVHDDQVVIGLQTEIANELRTGMTEHLGTIASGIVSETMAQWRAFQRAHNVVMSLSETNPRFASYLNTFADDDEIAPVALAVSQVLEIEGEDKLNDLIARGRFAEFVDLPKAGVTIAHDLQNVEAAMDWARVAGAQLAEVAASQLHRLREPGELTQASLSMLLALDEPRAIERAAAVRPELLNAMPRFGAHNVKRAADVFEASDLDAFMAGMLEINEVQARNIIWGHVPQLAAGDEPAFLGKVAAVGDSRDQTAAADLAFAQGWALFATARLAKAISSVWSGDISWTVVRERYTMLFFGFSGVLVLMVVVLLRQIVPRRRRKRARDA